MTHCKDARLNARRVRVAFILTPGFKLLNLTNFIETLDQSKHLAPDGAPLFIFHFLGSADGLVVSSCGVEIKVAAFFDAVELYDYLILLDGSLDIDHVQQKNIFDFLWRAFNSSSQIIALGTGVLGLADSGLLDGRRCAVHWYYYQNLKKYNKVFPILDESFVEDRGIISCPGGEATIDLALHILEKHFTVEQFVIILRYMLLNFNKAVDHPQQIDLKDYQNLSDPRVRKALFFVEQNISSLLSAEEAAEAAGISTRQLERLFQVYLRDSPAGYFRKLRLRHADWLLRNTDISISDIACKCGFTDSSHFAKRYKDLFFCSPGQARSENQTKKI